MSVEQLKVNNIFQMADSEHLYRLLWISEDGMTAYIFNMNTLEIPPQILCSEIIQQVSDGAACLQTSDPYIVVIAESDLSDNEKSTRNKIWELMKDLVLAEPQIYDKKQRNKLITEAATLSGKPRMTYYRYLKQYWKRGKTKNAFIPDYHSRGGKGKERSVSESKRGRPSKYESTGINVDETTKKVFEKSIKKYYHNRKENTLKYAYDMMIAEHYAKYITQPNGKTKVELPPEDELPTIRQFRYWYGKMYGEKEKIIKRKGETKFNLDHRAILGKSDYCIMGPGAKYQIDATIGDVYLVSRFNRKDIIGRPVLYFIIDVFSRMVTGMYVGLEGPSWAGMMMAIANAVSDKVKYCAEYGIEITETEWPCRGVPGAILGDRGELESKAADTLVNALNVRVENAPPYRADMKGIVEQHFNTINGTAVAFLPGRVKKEVRGGKDYRLDAKLDIHQLTKVIIQCVLHHNNHHLLEGFERTEEMVADDIVPIPLEMWNWGISNLSGALRSFPEETVKLALMPADKATITARGIKFKGLYYLCERAATEHWFETARAKGSWKVNISYDSRNMSKIYVRQSDGSVDICWLATWQDKYEGKCLHEVNYLHEVEKLLRRKNAPKEMTSKAELTAAIEDVIAEAEEMARQTIVPESKTERTKNIRENRHKEKEVNRQSEAFSLAEEESEENTTLRKTTVPHMEDEPIPHMLALIKKMQEERFNE